MGGEELLQFAAAHPGSGMGGITKAGALKLKGFSHRQGGIGFVDAGVKILTCMHQIKYDAQWRVYKRNVLSVPGIAS